MPFLFAAFLLGTPTPPPTDDDDPRAKTPSASAQADRDENDDQEEEGGTQPSSPIVVSAHKLDSARTQVEAGLGATVYSLTNEAIENRPGGETGSIADILAQAPGATISGKTLNVRGSSADEVRINGVILPEAIFDPADLISSRLAQTTRLMTGTLPAQFGFAPAGVVSVTTKNGLYQHGGEAELFGGSDGMIEPAFEWAGSAGATSLFASGELEHDRSQLGDSSGNVTVDRRTAVDGLGFADDVIDEHNRLSFLFGGLHERHRLDETASGAEANDNGYGVASYQHSAGPFSLEASLFGGLADESARFGTRTDERRGSWGTQIDATTIVNNSNRLAFGLLATRSSAREHDLGGLGSSSARTSLGLYAQDEWKLAPSLTLNGGARLEWLRGLHSGAHAEPRASLVWEPTGGLTAHIGYARYASAPRLGDEAHAKSLPDERDDYVDAGIEQQLGAFALGLGAYTRFVRNLIEEHQPLGSAVATAFEFERARVKGVELSSTFARGATTAWANLSLAMARGRRILGGEGLFDPQSIAAASEHDVALASDRPVSASGGFTQGFGKISLGADVLLSSGAVRTVDVADPNGSRRSGYALIGLSAVYHARLGGRAADVRLDLTNLTNVRYATSDAANLEGGWTHWGRRRAVTIGIEQTF